MTEAAHIARAPSESVNIAPARAEPIPAQGVGKENCTTGRVGAFTGILETVRLVLPYPISGGSYGNR